ncbi:unnamed protein product, partial [Meganyctiphanes norvegica]
TAMLKFLGKILLRIIVGIVIFITLLITLPGIPPHTTFTPYSVPPPLPRTGSLAPNNVLDGGRRLFEGKVIGPESVAVRGTNEIFVGVHDGTIQKIYGEDFDQIVQVTQTGEKCEGPGKENVCGRPLGLRFAPNGRLLVADAYYGILSVDVDTGDKETLVGPNEPIDGKVWRLPNDLDIDNEGNIYWSDSSTVADFCNLLLAAISDPTGRLIKYNPVTKTNTVLLTDIHLANGVQLSPNQDYVLLSETVRSQVHRYWLKGPKSGQSEIFIDRLPGGVDNIRPRPCGGYYISLFDTRHADNPEEYEQVEFLNKHSIIRKFIGRLFACTQLFFDSMHILFPLQVFEKASYYIFNIAPVIEMKNDSVAIIIEVNEDGNIIGSLQGSKGIIKTISETVHVGENIFFGSPFNSYIGHLHVGPTNCDTEGVIKNGSKENKEDEVIGTENSNIHSEDHNKRKEEL